MQQHHDVSPFARAFARPSARHQGESLLQRLAGRGPVDARDRLASQPSGAAERDWPDLDQRVRNVGEW